MPTNFGIPTLRECLEKINEVALEDVKKRLDKRGYLTYFEVQEIRGEYMEEFIKDYIGEEIFDIDFATKNMIDKFARYVESNIPRIIKKRFSKQLDDGSVDIYGYDRKLITKKYIERLKEVKEYKFLF